jgi:DNA-directed RNA polymerase subunit RPC12/RpoP
MGVRKMIYSCDCCGKEIQWGNQLVKLPWYRVMSDGTIIKWMGKAYICSDCLAEIGRTVHKKRKESEVNFTISVE